MDFRILGPLEVRRGETLLEVNGERRSLLLAALLLHPNQPVPAERLIGWVWPDRPDASAGLRPVRLPESRAGLRRTARLPDTDLGHGSRPSRGALHTHVRNLRRLLGSDGGELLQSSQTHGGQTTYRLVLERDQLDSLRFARLVAGARKGRHLHTAGQTATAERSASALRAALRLWRGGQVLAGLALPDPLAAEAERLQQLRLEALQARIDADLVLDRHADLLEELEQLVGAHPSVEAFHAQLMLARYRSGQQVAALDAYQHAYQVLTDGYGVEPGPELQRLQRRILARDPGLDSPAQAARRLGRPDDLPPEPPRLIGRQPVTERVRAALAGDGHSEPAAGPVPVVVVHGAGGVGKTALAVWVAHRLRARFPHGTLFADLRGSRPGDGGAVPCPADPAEVLARFLGALGLPLGDIPAGLAARASRFRTLVSDRRVLVVLDDAAGEAQVRPLLPGTAGCAVLVTGRSPLRALPATGRVTLGPLSHDHAVELLGAAIDPVDGAARARRDPEAARAVVERCDRLPLALRVAGGKLAARPSWTMATLAERLGERPLTELTLGDLSVRATLASSYAALDPRRQRALRLLALACRPSAFRIETSDTAGGPFAEPAGGYAAGGRTEGRTGGRPAPGWVTPEMAAALLDCDPPDAADVLDELVEAHLAEMGPAGERHPAGPGPVADRPAAGLAYRLPGLVAAFAAERLTAEEPPPSRAAAARRLARATGHQPEETSAAAGAPTQSDPAPRDPVPARPGEQQPPRPRSRRGVLPAPLPDRA